MHVITCFQHYDIYYIEADKQDVPVEEWKHIQTKDTTHVFDDMQTKTQYAINIRAVNDRGNGPFSFMLLDTG